MVREPPADLRPTREPGADPAAAAVIGTPPRKRRPSLKIAVDADEDEEEVEGDATAVSVPAMDVGGNGARFGGVLIEDDDDDEDTASAAAGVAFAKMFCGVCD